MAGELCWGLCSLIVGWIGLRDADNTGRLNLLALSTDCAIAHTALERQGNRFNAANGSRSRSLLQTSAGKTP